MYEGDDVSEDVRVVSEHDLGWVKTWQLLVQCNKSKVISFPIISGKLR